MEKIRAKAKKTKTKWVTITFDCEPETLKRLNEIADLSKTTLDQTVAVILAKYIIDQKALKQTFGKKSKVKTEDTSMFGLGDK